MAELGAGAEAASEEPVARDDRAADAGADGEHHHVADEPAGAEPELRPARGVRIVVDDDRRADAGLELLAEGLVAPVDVGGVVDGRLRGVDEAGRGDAHGRGQPVGGQRLDHRDDRVLEELRIPCGRRHAFAAHDRAELVDDRTGDLRSADVDTDRVHREAAFRREGEGE